VDLDHLQLDGDEVEDLGDVLAHQPQHPAAIGATLAGVEGDDLARRVGGDPWLAAAAGWQASLGCRVVGGLVIGKLVALRGRIGCGAGHLETFEGQFQLRDLAVGRSSPSSPCIAAASSARW